MAQQIIEALVFTLLAIPFVYMAYDVGRELTLKTVKVINKKVLPGIMQVSGSLFK